MDLSAVVAQQTAAQAAKYKSVAVKKETPLEADVGLLTITDPNPIDEEEYKADREAHLQALARDGVQALLTQVFALPTRSSVHGPLAILPQPTTKLPRAKPLPKPRMLTKWEKFANTKGISHRKRINKVFDEEKQEWVARWGYRGKNKEKEQQWLHEIPTSKPDDYDPRAEARKARKERTSKNELARQKNLEYNARTQAKRDEVDRSVARTRLSTASMGRFDKTLEGEKKPRGIKRKFAPNEASSNEKERSMALISKLDGKPVAKKARVDPRPNPGRTEDVLNVRKAVKFASHGAGSLALGRSLEKPKKRTMSKTTRKKMGGRH
ncbi:Rhodanese- sulfurtransferase [Tulasnella sp. 424]|nr:Rhodanese- sulfurtransferase [Tulasnella sp. 424]KAG8965427.1 Rhodanese- sulfurtransferase [Tulasnella sp. 425]